MTLRTKLIKALWQGNDPFASLPSKAVPNVLYLRQAIDALEPDLVVLLGVTGTKRDLSRLLSIAERLRALKGAGKAVLLAVEGRTSEPPGATHLKSGLSPAFQLVMTCVEAEGLSDIVLPAPEDNGQLVDTLKHLRLAPEVVVIGEGDDEAKVEEHVNRWWPILHSPGVMIGTGHRVGGEWPAFYNVFQTFCKTHNLPIFLGGPSPLDIPKDKNGQRRGRDHEEENNSIYVTKLFAEGGHLDELRPRLQAEYERFRNNPKANKRGKPTLMDRKALRSHKGWLSRRGWNVSWDKADIIHATPEPKAEYRFAASIVDAYLFLRHRFDCKVPDPWPDPEAIANPRAKETGAGPFCLFLAKPGGAAAAG